MKSSHPLFQPQLLQIVLSLPWNPPIHYSDLIPFINQNWKPQTSLSIACFPVFLFPNRLNLCSTTSILAMAFSIRHNFHFGIPATKKGLRDWTCPLHFHSSKIIISKLPAIKKGFEKLQHIFHCKAKSLSMIKIWSTSQKGKTEIKDPPTSR